MLASSGSRWRSLLSVINRWQDLGRTLQNDHGADINLTKCESRHSLRMFLMTSAERSRGSGDLWVFDLAFASD